MAKHQVVSRDKWVAARQMLLAEEKAFTRQRDRLSAARRELPWEKVEKDYVFHGPAGDVSLADLFDGRRRLFKLHVVELDFAHRRQFGTTFLGFVKARSSEPVLDPGRRHARGDHPA